MRQVQVHISLDVADDVTDDQILGWLPTVSAQVDEPVCSADKDGNEVTFAAEDVFIDCYVDGRVLTTIPA